MVLGDLERLIHALFDRDRRYHNHKLGEAVAAIQLEDGPQVHVGLARAGLHLHREVARGQRSRGSQPVAQLNVAEVRQNLIVQQVQAVADAQVVLAKSEGVLGRRRIAGDGELSPAGLLAAKQVAHRLDGGVLVVQVGFKVQLHSLPSRGGGSCFAIRSKSDSSIRSSCR